MKKNKYAVEFFVLIKGQTQWDLDTRVVEANYPGEAYSIIANELEKRQDISTFRIVETLDITTFG